MIPAARPASNDEVPVIDLSDLIGGRPLDALAARVRQACEYTGFFYITNHGVPKAVIDAAFEATRRYHALPIEQRMLHKIDERYRRGFMPYGVNQHPGFAPDLKESFEIGWDLPLDDPDVVAGRPLYGPNRWPEELPWLKQAGKAYFESVTRLGLELMRVLAIGLGKPETFFHAYFRKPMIQTRLFHYPPQPAVAPDDQLGVAPHTDYGLITLLLQDPIGGLELKKHDGEWVAAPWVEGSFVVNIGDLFQRWTNDLYVSNPHRVVNRTGQERYSIPTFFNLDYDAPIECLDTCTSAARPPKYPPILAVDYLLGRFRDVQKYRSKAA